MLCMYMYMYFYDSPQEHLRNQIIREQMMLMSVAEGVTSDTLPEDIVSEFISRGRGEGSTECQPLYLSPLSLPSERSLAFVLSFPFFLLWLSCNLSHFVSPSFLCQVCPTGCHGDFPYQTLRSCSCSPSTARL